MVSFKVSIALAALSSFAIGTDALEWKYETVEKASLGSDRRMLQGEGEAVTVSVSTTALIEEFAQLARGDAELSRFVSGATMNLPLTNKVGTSFRLIHDDLVMAPGLAARYPNIIPFVGKSMEGEVNVAGTFSMEKGLHLQFQDGNHMSYMDPLEDGVDMDSETTLFHIYNAGDGEAPEFSCGSKETVFDGREEKRSLRQEPTPTTSLRKLADVECDPRALGDFVCDPEFNVPECGFDGGDCCGGAYGEDCGVDDASACECLDPRANVADLRLYRLAMSANNKYSLFHGNTTESVLAAIVTTVARVNGIYKRDLTIAMQLINDTDLLIELDVEDPFLPNESAAINANGKWIKASGISNDAYDIGHVVTTGSGGVAGYGVVCSPSQKSRGTTGLTTPINDQFDVDYVAHEIGHQFHGAHTWAGCENQQAQRSFKASVEPGSGSTIMAYAGICSIYERYENGTVVRDEDGAPIKLVDDNVADKSNPHFHSYTLEEMRRFISNPATGGSCGTVLKSNIQRPVIEPVLSYTTELRECEIPNLTPFRLQAVNVDVSDYTIAYSWEHSDASSTVEGGRLASYQDETSILFNAPVPKAGDPSQIYPSLQYAVSGQFDPANRLPNVERNMEMTMAVRNYFDIDGDDMEDASVDIGFGVSYVGTPIQMTVTGARAYDGSTDTDRSMTVSALTGPLSLGESFTVTWEGGLPDSATPGSKARVLLSLDGGKSFPRLLKADATHNAGGSTSVTISGTKAEICGAKETRVRVMVEVFHPNSPGCTYFAVSPTDISITECGTFSTPPPTPPTAQPTFRTLAPTKSPTVPQVLTVTSVEQTLKSQEEEEYSNGLHLGWVFVADDDTKSVQIEFTEFHMEKGWDFVYLFNDVTGYSDVQPGDNDAISELPGLIAILDGRLANLTTTTFVSEEDTLIVRMYTDTAYVEEGFTLTYNTVDRVTRRRLEEVEAQASASYSTAKRDEDGFESLEIDVVGLPMEPYVETYTATTGEPLRVIFDQFQMTRNHWIKIYKENDVLVASFTGDMVPVEVNIDTPKIKIEYAAVQGRVVLQDPAATDGMAKVSYRVFVGEEEEFPLLMAIGIGFGALLVLAACVAVAFNGQSSTKEPEMEAGVVVGMAPTQFESENPQY